MKKLTFYLFTTLLLTTFSATDLIASATSVSTTDKSESAEVKSLLIKLNDIKAVKKSSLSRKEKKEVRTEARSTKAELRDHGHYGGIYISGGIILLVVLLIILL